MKIKNYAIMLVVLLMAFSCRSLTPEAKLQIAQKSMLESVSLLQEAKASGKLKGQDLIRAKKLVVLAHTAVQAWRQSVLTDKEEDRIPMDRPDLSRVIYNALGRLEKYGIIVEDL